ncbi:tetratricopeptide repeat protein [Hyphococcus sp. DH-69]|uniref:tetratricopeptide repeat protein n=1 Tax=Hyphococcus formosus TaxID=3143534 RepID=UPI00398B835A
MRTRICALFSGLFLAVFAAFPALADQTDPRLDSLFEELRVGDAIRAEENVARIIEIWADSQSDTVDLLYQRAELSANNGAFDLSIALLDHIIGLAPNFAQSYALRGTVRLTQEDRAGAIEDFSRALELEPRHFLVRVTLAEILLAGGSKREAYEMFQKALEWNPHDENARDRARYLRREIDGQEI